tara:strand:+ start:3664 stop:4641 length:978 start_codon:yes stop_codon:yes gene_type:complete
MKKNIAVVGCGHWGKNLVRNFFSLGHLKYISDSDEKISKELSSELNVQSATFDELLSDEEIEGVVIGAPAIFHASMSIKAMKAKKHVFVEKPFAIDKEEANAMINTSKQEDVQLMVGHLLQYHPIFQKLKSIIEERAIGEMQYIYSNRMSFGKIRTEEDVIWSFAPHDISMILSLVQSEPISVRTLSSRILQEHIADKAILHIIFEGGLKAHISVSWLHPYKDQKLVIVGESGMAVFDDTEIWEKKLAIYKHLVEFPKNKPHLEKAEAEYIIVPQSEPLKEECKYFIDLISGNVPPLTDGNEGLRVVNILAAASLSEEKGQIVNC